MRGVLMMTQSTTVAPNRPRPDAIPPNRLRSDAIRVRRAYWCELPAGHDAGVRQVAHRAALWELEDRVEICVLQMPCEGLPDGRQVNRQPMLYFWCSEYLALSDAECAAMAAAMCRAAELLHRVNVSVSG
jgi:hypothetical protein